MPKPPNQPPEVCFDPKKPERVEPWVWQVQGKIDRGREKPTHRTIKKSRTYRVIRVHTPLLDHHVDIECRLGVKKRLPSREVGFWWYRRPFWVGDWDPNPLGSRYVRKMTGWKFVKPQEVWPWEEWWLDVWQCDRSPWRRDYLPPEQPESNKMMAAEIFNPAVNPAWPFMGVRHANDMVVRKKALPWEMPPHVYRRWLQELWQERADDADKVGMGKSSDREVRNHLSNAGGKEVHVVDPSLEPVLPENAVTEWREDPSQRTPSEVWSALLTDEHMKAAEVYTSKWGQNRIEQAMQRAGISWRWFEREMIENHDFYRYIIRRRAQKLGSRLLRVDEEVMRRIEDVGLENADPADIDRYYRTVSHAEKMASKLVAEEMEKNRGPQNATFVVLPAEEAQRVEQARKELQDGNE